MSLFYFPLHWIISNKEKEKISFNVFQNIYFVTISTYFFIILAQENNLWSSYEFNSCAYDKNNKAKLKINNEMFLGFIQDQYLGILIYSQTQSLWKATSFGIEIRVFFFSVTCKISIHQVSIHAFWRIYLVDSLFSFVYVLLVFLTYLSTNYPDKCPENKKDEG